MKGDRCLISGQAACEIAERCTDKCQSQVMARRVPVEIAGEVPAAPAWASHGEARVRSDVFEPAASGDRVHENSFIWPSAFFRLSGMWERRRSRSRSSTSAR